MPVAPEELSNAQKLENIIEKVLIVKGRITSDPVTWEFHMIGDTVLRVDTDKLEKYGVFRQQYLKEFCIPAPDLNGKEWIKVLSALVEDGKTENVEAPEESERVFIARQIFEIVCAYDISEDPEEALSGQYLYKHVIDKENKVRYCMPSTKFLELVSNAGFKIPSNVLSETMTELGMKCNGTPRVRYCGPQVRSWCFIPETVLRQQEE
jgi:hypothetical protein